jgi:hypothetical protein
MSALYFTVTGVQFWGTKYLTVALHAPLPLVSTLFIKCDATCPTLDPAGREGGNYGGLDDGCESA